MIALLVLVIGIALYLQVVQDSRREAGPHHHLVFTLFINYITFDRMKKQILKSQFVDDGNGNLVVTGKIAPVNSKGNPAVLDPSATVGYESSDSNVLLIAQTGSKTFAIKYVGPGTVTLTGKGRSLSGKGVPGVLELVVVDDTVSGGGDDTDTEAVDLGMSLDVATTDVPEQTA